MDQSCTHGTISPDSMLVVRAFEAPRHHGKKHKGRARRGDPGVAEVSGLPKDISQVQHPVAICCPVGMDVLPATHVVAPVDTGVAASKDASTLTHVVTSSAIPANAFPLLLTGTTSSGTSAPTGCEVSVPCTQGLGGAGAVARVAVGPFDQLVSWLRAKRLRRLHSGFWLWRASTLLARPPLQHGSTPGLRHPTC